MIALQAFNGSASLTALLVGAAVSERAETEREITLACGQLAAMVTRIAASDRRPTFPTSEREQAEKDTARNDQGPRPTEVEQGPEPG
jgi:hypothetical protein